MNEYNITDEKYNDIVFGYTNTNAGAKKLSWFFDVELNIVKKIIKQIREKTK